VAAALAGTGQHEQAVTVACSIIHPDQRTQALAAVAAALAEARQHDKAATVARSITDPDRQAQALVASALAAKGDTRQARHVASAACAVGRWTTVLRLVLPLEPSAVRVLTDP
jgi:hypothetical protein